MTTLTVVAVVVVSLGGGSIIIMMAGMPWGIIQKWTGIIFVVREDAASSAAGTSSHGTSMDCISDPNIF
jgi:hypothetical protein